MSRRYHALRALLLGAVLASPAACGGDEPTPEAADPASVPGDALTPPATSPPVTTDPIPADPWSVGPPLGARRYVNGDLEVRVRAPNATHVDVCLFSVAMGEKERIRRATDRDATGLFHVRIDAATLAKEGLAGTIYYGLRAFGPNWRFDPTFVPGSEIGFVSDVDDAGNRMNPNKLLLDPYALEVSHDPINLENGSGAAFRAGPEGRTLDSALVAPKGVVVAPPLARPIGQPTHPIRDDVVYEVHVRGFTKNDDTVPEAERGTYRGAARRARYLKELGVRAIELLPVHETPNDQNDRTPESQGDNYWGYSTLSFFAPDRRYAFDKSPGGPTRELRAMVEAFHAEGIKVWIDVVYNHTAEGGANGPTSTVYSFRGLDNRTFYELGATGASYVSSNGVGPNVNTAEPVVADLVVDSLRYWYADLGVDGFRFDLAPIVANGCTRSCYRFDKALPTRIAKDLPARPDDGGAGADLVAEPWGLADGSYQVGGFPKGWSEWNDRYRDTVRRGLNRLDVAAVPPREIAQRVRGSADVYGGAGRPPAASVNFVVAHDGMTLADLFSYDSKNNEQAWPFGPSNGGTDNDLSWSHASDPARQRAATRTAFALAALSAGVPMFTGGDERLRTQRGNNNAYNLDSPAIWLDWTPNAQADAFASFAARTLGFRNTHVALRPKGFWKNDEVSWLDANGNVASDGYLDSDANRFLAWSLNGGALGDGAKRILIAFNRSAATVTMALPVGSTWQLVGDTSEAAEAWGNWKASPTAMPGSTHALGRRSVAVFVAN